MYLYIRFLTSRSINRSALKVNGIDLFSGMWFAFAFISSLLFYLSSVKIFTFIFLDFRGYFENVEPPTVNKLPINRKKTNQKATPKMTSFQKIDNHIRFSE